MKQSVICNFRLPTAVSDFSYNKITTHIDFAVQKKHAFIRNVFDQDELKQSIPISKIEK